MKDRQGAVRTASGLQAAMTMRTTSRAVVCYASSLHGFREPGFPLRVFLVFLGYSIRCAATGSFHILSRSLVMTQVPYHAPLCSLSYSCPTVQCAAVSNCSHYTVAPADMTCLLKQKPPQRCTLHVFTLQ